MADYGSTPTRRPPLLLVGAIAGGVLFAALTFAVTATTDPAFDVRVADWARAELPLWADTVAGLVNLVAATAPIVLTPLLALWLWFRRRRRDAVVYGVGIFAALALSVTVKLLVGRTRPLDSGVGLPVDSDETSFPSTSVVVCVVFWGLAAILAMRAAGRAAPPDGGPRSRPPLLFSSCWSVRPG